MLSRMKNLLAFSFAAAGRAAQRHCGNTLSSAGGLNGSRQSVTFKIMKTLEEFINL